MKKSKAETGDKSILAVLFNLKGKQIKDVILFKNLMKGFQLAPRCREKQSKNKCVTIRYEKNLRIKSRVFIMNYSEKNKKEKEKYKEKSTQKVIGAFLFYFR